MKKHQSQRAKPNGKAKPDEPGERAVITVPEAARLLGIGRLSVIKAVHRGEIESVRVGRRILIPKGPFNEKFGIVSAARSSNARPARAPLI